ncbi:MAG: hypothetical protein AAB930_00855 [Patescibacteria group bacterium]
MANKSEKRNLVISIGTAGVQALEYSFPPGGGNRATDVSVPEVMNIIELNHDPLPTVEEKALLRSIRRDLIEIKKQISDARTESVTLILSSPWYFSQSRSVVVERDRPFIVDKPFINQLLDEEKRIFLNRATTQLSIPESDEPELLETSIMSVLLNGYETDSFLGKKVQHLRLSIYMSMTLRSLFNELRSIMEEHFSPKKVIVHSGPYVIFKTAVQILEIGSAGAVIVDIGGEITDIIVIRGGIIAENLSFGRGLHFILRRMSSVISVSPAEALSYLKAYADGHADESQKKKLGAVLSEAMTEWQGMFYQAIAGAARVSLLPNSFMLIGEGAQFNIFSSVIEKGGWEELLYRVSPIKIETLYPKFFRDHLRGGGKQFGGGPASTQLFFAMFSTEQEI